MKRTLLAVVAAFCSVAAYGAFMTGFEAPTYSGSAAGTLLTTGFGGGGQDGWYLPLSGSVDWNVYTYAGNALGFSTLPVVGQSQFIGGMADASGAGFARAQRAENFAASNTWTASYYIAWKFAGTLPASQNVGSFSQQPTASARYWQTLYTWVDPNTGDMINSGFLAYDAFGTQFPQPGQYPGPEWQNLPLDHWYRQDTTWDYVSNTILRISITDMNTGITTVALPPYPVPAGGTDQWYLTGGPGGGGFPLPTDYRFFAGGIQNVEAVDNLAVKPGMSAVPMGPLLPVFQTGILLSGDVRSLYESEDAKLVVRPGIVLSSAQYPVNFQLTFVVATASPPELDIIVESSANQANIGQQIFVYNNVTMQDEQVDSHTLTTTDTTTTVAVTSNTARFIDANRNVKVRIRCKPVGPVLNYPWQARFDRVMVAGTP